MSMTHAERVLNAVSRPFDSLGSNRRQSSEPSYHPTFGQFFDFEIFNYFDSGQSAQHIVKLSVSNLV